MLESSPQHDLSCSVRNVLEASLPMIFSILSGALMQLVDRSLLGRYSIVALDGAMVAQQLFNAFMLPCLSFAAMAEVFVGQFNGARQFRQTSVPIPQITLFLIALEIIIAPLAISLRTYMIPERIFSEGSPYFLVGLTIVPFQVLHSAVAAFFVGTRRPTVTLYSVVVANVVNIVFDYLFIFGIDPWIRPMGALGAALSTLLSTITSALILLFVYLNPQNTKVYGTRKFVLDLGILKRNIILGAPYAFALFLEMGNWVIIANILEDTSASELDANSLALSLWSFLFFVVEGFQKGVTALASNCVGAGKEAAIPRLVRSMGKIALIVLVLSAIPFVVFPEPIFKHVFGHAHAFALPNFRGVLLVQWVSFSILVFTMSGIIGILNANGDTLHVTAIRISCFVVCIFIPVLVISHITDFTTLHSWSLGLANIIVTGTCFFLRYRSNRWRHQLVAARPRLKQ